MKSNPKNFPGSFGPQYEIVVSKSEAIALLGTRRLPDMGRQTVVAIAGADQADSLLAFRPRLILSNFCGYYFLRSPDLPQARWKATFGFDGHDSPGAIAAARAATSPQVEFDSPQWRGSYPIIP